MNPETITTAADFLAWQESIGPYDNWTGEQRTLRKRLFKSLPPPERYLVQREGIERYFTEENRCTAESGCGVPREYLSPSGRYKLVVTSYGTKPGAWNYTRGEVFRVSDGERVADVKRNYSSFPFSWMESHVNGHDYLVAGEDYQGQTFCELDTGRSKSHIPDEAFEGFGFCWAGHRLLDDGRTLLVDGCYWACPYETRFYDVSDPMEGWPELKIPDEPGSLDADGEVTYDAATGIISWSQGARVFKPTRERESEIDHKLYDTIWAAKRKAEREGNQAALSAAVTAEAEHHAKYPEPEDAPDQWERVVDHIIRLRRDGEVLVLIDEWKSEYLLEQERHRQEYADKSKAERRQWRASDPLLAALEAHLGGPSALDGLVSFMYPSVVMRENGDKNPAYFRLSGRKYDPEKDHNHWVDIGWGIVDGPVVVEMNVRGKGVVSKPEFPRTPEGILAAWAAGQAHLAAEPTGGA